MARFKQTGKPKPAPCRPANQPITKQEAQAVAKRLASLGKSLTRSVKKTVHTVRWKSARFYRSPPFSLLVQTESHKPFTTYAEGASRAEAEALLSTCGGVERTNSSRFLSFDLTGEQLVSWLTMERTLGPVQHTFTGFGGRIPVSFLHLFVTPVGGGDARQLEIAAPNQSANLRALLPVQPRDSRRRARALPNKTQMISLDSPRRDRAFSGRGRNR